MKWEKISKLKDTEFRRLTGIKRKTFNTMIEILKKEKEKSYKNNPKRSGRKPKLSIEDQLLMALEYWREYRTFFHLANSYGTSETRAHENVRKIENILIKSGKFNLPKRKEKLLSNNSIEVFFVDATETPI